MGCVGCPDCNTCPNCCTTTPPCPVGVQCHAFFASVLGFMGAPVTTNNINILLKWSSYENTAAGWNPLATTLVHGTYSWWNCAPNFVKCYANEADGVAATALTLELSFYTAIHAALMRDAPIHEWACTPIPAEIDTWGTGGFATYLRSLSCTTPVPTPTPHPVPVPVPVPTPHPPPPSPTPTVGGLLVPAALLAAGVGLAVVASRRDPAFGRRVGEVADRLRGGAEPRFG